MRKNPFTCDYIQSNFKCLPSTNQINLKKSGRVVKIGRCEKPVSSSNTTFTYFFFFLNKREINYPKGNDISVNMMVANSILFLLFIPDIRMLNIM